MLSHELQKQIENEAVEGQKAHPYDDYDHGYNNGYERGYEAAGEKYGQLHETALARAERAEKALREFANKLNEHCGQQGIYSAGIHRIIDEMLMYEHVNNKIRSDE